MGWGPARHGVEIYPEALQSAFPLITDDMIRELTKNGEFPTISESRAAALIEKSYDSLPDDYIPQTEAENQLLKFDREPLSVVMEHAGNTTIEAWNEEHPPKVTTPENNSSPASSPNLPSENGLYVEVNSEHGMHKANATIMLGAKQASIFENMSEDELTRAIGGMLGDQGMIFLGLGDSLKIEPTANGGLNIHIDGIVTNADSHTAHTAVEKALSPLTRDDAQATINEYAAAESATVNTQEHSTGKSR